MGSFDLHFGYNLSHQFPCSKTISLAKGGAPSKQYRRFKCIIQNAITLLLFFAEKFYAHFYEEHKK